MTWKDYYEEGWRNALRPVTACPYPRDTEANIAWRAGWHDWHYTRFGYPHERR